MAYEASAAEMERLNYLILQLQLYNKQLDEHSNREYLTPSEKEKIEDIRRKKNDFSVELSALVLKLKYNPSPSVKALYWTNLYLRFRVNDNKVI